jgi:microsomal dipeptidase-like Zn-dependent dipeptidase
MGVENICFGSDWPHPEGLAEPWSYVDHLPDDLGDAEIAAIMGGNLSRAMKVGVPA